MAKEAIADDIFERLMTMLQQVLVTCYIFGAVSKAGPVTKCQNNTTAAEPQARGNTSAVDLVILHSLHFM